MEREVLECDAHAAFEFARLRVRLLLDADTERRVLQNIASEYGGRTTIIFVTHRPEALRHATQTLRLEKTGK